MSQNDHSNTPLSQAKEYEAPSVFVPENLLREARRQKGLARHDVPPVCILDPDGDIVRHLRATDRAAPASYWPGYHTTLYTFQQAVTTMGIVGCAVGAPFAVLVAEQLFASGCQLLISITSSGQICPRGPTPYFVLIDRALRDEGTSHHYLPPSKYVALRPPVKRRLDGAFDQVDEPVHRGAVWTTDAPFRETQAAIEYAEKEGVLAVEMEAAALYAFAEARGRSVVCFAHVTNQMAQEEGDFEKGDAHGSRAALQLIQATVSAWEAGEE